MTCEEFRARSRDFAWARLDLASAELCHAHLGGCEACAAWYGAASALTCRELTEFLHEYVEGALAAGRRAVFEDHLRICTECEVYVDGYRRTVALGKDAAAPAESASPAVPQKLISAILAARSKQG